MQKHAARLVSILAICYGQAVENKLQDHISCQQSVVPIICVYVGGTFDISE